MQCPRWVKRRHPCRADRCLLYPRKRTLVCVERRTSANRSHPTHLCRFGAAFALFGTRGRRLVGNLVAKGQPQQKLVSLSDKLAWL